MELTFCGFDLLRRKNDMLLLLLLFVMKVQRIFEGRALLTCATIVVVNLKHDILLFRLRMWQKHRVKLELVRRFCACALCHINILSYEHSFVNVQ